MLSKRNFTLVFLASVLLLSFSLISGTIAGVHAASNFSRTFTPSLPTGNSTPINSALNLRITVTSTDGTNPLAAEAGVPVSATTSNGATIYPANGVTDENGTISFTITSSRAIQSSVNIIAAPSPGPTTTVLTQSVTFTAPSTPAAQSSSPATPKSTSKKSAKNQPSMSSVAQTSSSSKKTTKQAAPPLTDVTFDGQKVSSSNFHKVPIISKAKPFVIGGKTSPNTEVTIYVFSKPRTFKTKSDAKGYWEVIVSNLPEGKHHAEFEIKDKDKKVLPRIQLGNFEIAANTINTKRQTVQQENPVDAISLPKPPILIGVAIAIIVLISSIIAFFVVRKRRRKKDQGLSIF